MHMNVFERGILDQPAARIFLGDLRETHVVIRQEDAAQVAVRGDAQLQPDEVPDAYSHASSEPVIGTTAFSLLITDVEPAKRRIPTMEFTADLRERLDGPAHEHARRLIGAGAASVEAR